MPHWNPRDRREAYDHPAGRPPPPQPMNTNSVLSRLVRIETYLQATHAESIRLERESLRRDVDLYQRLTIIETLAEPIQSIAKVWRLMAASTKFLTFAAVVALWLNGALTWAQLTSWLASAFGLPTP